MPKIIIIGDSFAADWSCQTDVLGWPNLLSKKYSVTNIAQAGVSEYKIYKQVLTTVLDDYNIVIISHTNPYRVHTKKHPLHNDQLHNHCDLIYTDISYHSNKLKNVFNKSLSSAVGYFDYHFDIEYYETMYKLLRNEIDRLLSGKIVIELNFFEDCKGFTNPNTLDFCQLFADNRGSVNHLNTDANLVVFKEIDRLISQKYK